MVIWLKVYFMNNFSLQKLSVLYVENDNIVRLDLENKLKDKLKSIYCAVDGIEGLEQFKLHKPDIIITDITMPRMDGINMSILVREIDTTVPIIVLSNEYSIKYLTNILNLGMIQYFRKPVEHKRLIEILEAISKDIVYEK